MVPIQAASGSASAASVDVPETTALPEPELEPVAAPKPVSAPSTSEPESVPLPSAPSEPAPAVASMEPSVPVPLPSESVALPDLPSAEPVEPEVNVESQKQVAKATQDAFSGAFSSELLAEEETAPPAPEEPVAEAEPEPASEPEEEFVSAAEHFIAADEDGSGALDVEELAQATGTSLEEAAELHAEADTDGDGVVTLSEFIASPAAEKTASFLNRLRRCAVPSQVNNNLCNPLKHRPSSDLSHFLNNRGSNNLSNKAGPSSNLANSHNKAGLNSSHSRLAATAGASGPTNHSFGCSLPWLRHRIGPVLAILSGLRPTKPRLLMPQ